MKSADISKFDIDWQVFRVGLKKLPTHMDKAMSAADYVFKHSNRADKERVLNYLQGLAIAYRGEDRADVELIADELSHWPVSDENPTIVDFHKHSQQELMAVARDLMTRTEKWLKKGYRHEEQIAFLKSLLEYLGASTLWAKLNKSIAYSKTIPNTHKFLF